MVSGSSTSKRRFLANKHQRPESQPLLSSSSHTKPDFKQINATDCLVGFCPTSKAVLLVLSWTVFVGALQFTILNLAFFLIAFGGVLPIKVPSAILMFYASVALVYFFYPVSGYFADIYCGRFRMIVASLVLLLCFIIVGVTICAFVPLLPSYSFWITFFGSVSVLCAFIAIIGIAGYGANFIQFGLDQLLDAPSHHQALFVHWAKWCCDLMSAAILFFFVYVEFCSDPTLTAQLTGGYLFVLLLEIVLACLLVTGCCKRHWFNSEPTGQLNPYKTVFRVLNFARKHPYPLQRSAFTYCDDERPSRVDFAKDRFGGPFTTEQVEDVKTLVRIVLILFAVAPVSILDVPTSAVSMALMGVHLGPSTNESVHNLCEWNWIIVNCGILRCIISTLFLPVYTSIIFTLFRKRVPKIFCRLGFGVILYLLGGLSIFFVDIIGHTQYQGNGTQCIVVYDSDYDVDISSLGMHWAVYIPSNVLVGLGPTIVTVTIFEFISAQSPHSMKGLLLGTYYAITGVYQFMSSVVLVPFTSYEFQANRQSLPRYGCLFGYFLFVSFIALIGLVWFIVAARCYRYREREDRPYDQRFVIDIYNRYLNEVRNDGLYSDSGNP